MTSGKRSLPIKQILSALLLLLLQLQVEAQPLLNKVIDIQVSKMPMPEVLQRISASGKFLFSYNSDLVWQHKEISLNEQHKSVRQLLDLIFEGNYHYTEHGNYIIIHQGGERSFTISGYIQNGRTGARISNATVYENRLLAAAQTNDQGYFRLLVKNKDRYKTISLTVSKEQYTDFSTNLNAGYDQEVTLPIVPDTEIVLDDVLVHKDKIEATWASRFFVSSKQKIQALNIGKFIAQRPVQTSLIPGIGTHGMIGSNVVNKFSLNMLGGYTAGVRGVEIGGLFNINRKDVQAVQVAGIFNNVGGNTQGVQLAGIFNNVLGYTQGVQLAGIGNRVNGPVTGVQIAGIGNHNTGNTQAVQVAGLINRDKGSTEGVLISGLFNDVYQSATGIQVAGLMNRSRGHTEGLQIAGLVNYAQHMSGIQLSVINITDTLDGYCIGLFNYSRNGYHQLIAGTNELQLLTLGYRSGNRKLYTVWNIGSSVDVSQKMYSVGYGAGREWRLSNRLALAGELIVSGYYIGDFTHMPVSARIQSSVSYKVYPFLSIYAGPAYTACTYQNGPATNGYITSVYQEQRNGFHSSKDLTGWIGWQLGVYIF